MKFYIILLITMATSVTSYSQNTFEFRLPVSDQQEQMDIIEDNYGNVIVLNSYREQGGLFYSKLFKISPDGDTCSKTLHIADTNIVGYKIIVNNDNSYFIVFEKWLNDTTGESGYYSIMKFDENFNELSQFNYILPDCYRSVDISSFFKLDNRLVTGGTAKGQWASFAYDDSFIAITDTLGNLLNERFFTEDTLFDKLYSIQYDTSKMVFRSLGEGFSIHSALQYVEIDTNLNVINVLDIPFLYEQPANLYVKGDNEFIITNAYRNLLYFSDVKINIALLDSNMHDVSNMYWDSLDSYDPPAWYKSLVVLDDGSYVVGGTIQIWYNFFPSWFVLGHVTEGMLGDWERYYGGDYYYHMCNVIRTKDGGYVMGGKYADTLNPDHYGIYILKVDSNGMLNGINENEILDHSAILYLDPSQSQLVVRVSYPEDLDLRLYDVTGRLLICKQGIRNEQRIPVTSFKPGMIIYEFRDKHNHCKTGKVVIP